MSDLICDTSSLQYLYQLELLHILPALAERVLIPPAVIEELAAGLALGVSLPDVETLEWMTVRRPLGEIALPLVVNLGPGEAGVLMLALRDGLLAQGDFVPGTYLFYTALAAGESTEHIAQTLRQAVALNPRSSSLRWALGDCMDSRDTLSCPEQSRKDGRCGEWQPSDCQWYMKKERWR